MTKNIKQRGLRSIARATWLASLIGLLIGLAWPVIMHAQGTCSQFAAGVCPANIPSGVTHFYFVDPSNATGNASDSNTGANETTQPFLHFPGCVNATGNSAAALSAAASGTGFIVRGGGTIGSACYPAQLPYGGASSLPDYWGYDPGWPASGWTRPVVNGGGSSGYNSNAGSLFSDISNHAANLIVDNIEFTGLYWNGTACSTNYATCGYVTWHCDLSCTNSNVNWEFKNLYAHNVTHSAWPNSTDPANTGALFWMARDSGSSFHDSVIDNTDGGQDCCQGVYAANIYNDVFLGIDNVVFSPSASNNAFNPFIFHDNSLKQVATSLYPQSIPTGSAWASLHAYTVSTIITPTSNNPNSYSFNVITAGTSGSTQPTWSSSCASIGQICTDTGGVQYQNWTKTGQEPHGNCIHVFGNQSSSFNELIYNNYDQCDNANAETLLMEENSANIYAFNNVFVDITQPNGLSPSNFTSGGGTYNIFDNTLECGVDPTPANTCIRAGQQSYRQPVE